MDGSYSVLLVLTFLLIVSGMIVKVEPVQTDTLVTPPDNGRPRLFLIDILMDTFK
jgi:hypothetical protein